MPTPTEQLLSRTSYAGDGATTAWDFTFASGYIDKSHVKAYTVDAAFVRTELTITEANFIGEFQLSITPPVPVNTTLTIYRDTPKDTPLVDFADGSNLTEAALDTLAKQAVFVAAEVNDNLNILVGPELAAIAEQISIDADAAAASAVAAAASAVTAAGAAATAASDTEDLVQPLVDAAAASAAAAALSAASADASETVVLNVASSLPANFGFNPNGAYDFGLVTDPNTYLNTDCGTVP